MKNLFILILLGLCFGIYQVKACQLSIPESYVQTFLNPPVSGHYEKCESEPCHCVDNINPYFSELVDNYVIDYVSQRQYESCLDEADCDDKFSRIVCLDGTEIKNYETLSVYCAVNVMKIEGKKLVESESKKDAYKAARKAEKDAEQSARESKKALKLAIKEDVKTATTVAKLKALIEKLIEAQDEK